jgi:replicative DNA helicase
LDKYFTCISIPSLTVIAGRSNTGKTSFVLNLIENMSEQFKGEKTILHFSMVKENFETIENNVKAKQKDVGAVFIDSFDSLVVPHTDDKDEQNEMINSLMVKLKNLSSDLNIPIFITTQITEEAHKNIRPYPKFHLLKGDGVIEEHSDLVLFFERDDTELDAAENKCSVFIEKNRLGKTGEVELYFDKETNKFSNLTR